MAKFFKHIASSPDEGKGQTKDCPVCNGTGNMPAHILAQMPVPSRAEKCSHCDGTGKVHK